MMMPSKFTVRNSCMQKKMKIFPIFTVKKIRGAKKVLRIACDIELIFLNRKLKVVFIIAAQEEHLNEL